MTTFRQLSFSKGEIDPSLRARVDTTAYQTGLATCRNTTVKKQGGLETRPGTEYCGEIKNSARTVRLIDWVFNDDQAYVLEVGHNYIRFWKDGALVTTSPSAWNSGAAYVAGNTASFGGTNYICILAHTNNTPPNATYWYALTGSIVEVPTTYAEADLQEINYAQNADVMILVHPSYPPKSLSRIANDQWAFATTVFGTSVPRVRVTSPNANAIQPTVPPEDRIWAVTAVIDGEEGLPDYGRGRAPTESSPITVTWSAVSGADSYRIYRGNLGGAAGFIGVSTGTSFSDDGSVEEDYLDLPPADPGLFSATGDYPSAVTFSQQSLFFGGSVSAPETLWKSLIGHPFNFNVKTPITDSSAVTATISGQRVNGIRHLADVRRMVALTMGGAVSINGDSAGIIKPTDVGVKQQNYQGSALVRPVAADTLLYIYSRGSQVLSLDYSLEQDGFNAPDLSLFSAHLLSGRTIVDWAFQRVPNSILWCILDNGDFLGLTYVKDQEVLAWHRHDTDGLVENVCSIPEGTQDAIYMIVNRTINGNTKRYVERMHTRVVSDIVDFVGMDCSHTYDGVAISTVAGLSHLEGKSVSVLADGFVIASPNNPDYEEIVVTGGSISLGASYSVIHVGLPITADVETLNIDSAGRTSTVMQFNKIVTEVKLHLNRSRGGFVGGAEPDDDSTTGLREIPALEGSDEDAPPELVSDITGVTIPGEWNSSGKVFIRQVDPLPLSILAITAIGQIGGS